MNLVMQLIQEQWVLGLVQMLVGKLIKQSFAGKLNAFIPLLNVVLAALGFTLAPATASAAGVAFSTIGFVTPVTQGLGVVAMSILQTLVVTGTHSTFKNTVVPGLKAGVSWIFGALNPWLTKQ